MNTNEKVINAVRKFHREIDSILVNPDKDEMVAFAVCDPDEDILAICITFQEADGHKIGGHIRRVAVRLLENE